MKRKLTFEEKSAIHTTKKQLNKLISIEREEYARRQAKQTISVTIQGA